MGKISASHVAGLDLIDKLFFNQIPVLCRFHEEEIAWLQDLGEDLERELTHKGITGVQRQVVKHGVLCMMEADLSESVLLLRETMPIEFPALPKDVTSKQHEQARLFTLHYFKEFVLAVLSKAHQCDQQVVLAIASALVNKYKSAPVRVRYRLTERMLAYEFMFAPIDCFTWLSKIQVLQSKKHPGANLQAQYRPEFLQRLVLLCELDMVRDYTRRQHPQSYVRAGRAWEIESVSGKISEETEKSLAAQEEKDAQVINFRKLRDSFPVMSLFELEDPDSVHRYFGQLNQYATRFRVFQSDSLASWVGMLCGGFIEVLDRQQEKKPVIYSECSNEGSLTYKVSESMNARGFQTTARTIYQRHRDFKNTVLKIVNVYASMSFLANVAVSPHMSDMIYDAVPYWIDKCQPRAHSPCSVKVPLSSSPSLSNVWLPMNAGL